MKKKELVHQKKKGGHIISHEYWLKLLVNLALRLGVNAIGAKKRCFLFHFPLYLPKTLLLPISKAGFLLEC